MNQPANTFRQAIQEGRLALTAELSLKRESSADDVSRQASMFRDRVDAMQVADNPLARVHMSALAASDLLLNEGMDAIPILTCRDRNRIALQSDLLGMRAMGISSAILTGGRKVGKNHALHTSTVFDVLGSELISMAAALNEDEALPNGENLFIGTGAKACRASEGWAAEPLIARADAGAEFIQTQVCLNIDLLENWMHRMVEAKMTWRFSIVVSVSCLPSAETARWVKENMLDSIIPNGIIERLEQATDPEQEGIAICAEKMQQTAEIPGISGINLISMGNPQHLAAAIDLSGLRN
jgi:methylenetetrahydrofolate reductase (NADPH)